jgi:uncharacterized protein (TIGR02145 family)
MKTKLFLLSTLATLCLAFTACNETPPEIPEATQYIITMRQPATGGKIEASASKSAAGKAITLTAKPQTGYELSEWTTTTDGVAFVNRNAETTTFTMPERNVTISAQFTESGGDDPGDDEPGKVTGVTLNVNAMTLQVGNQQTLTATVSPSNASNKSVTWTSSNTSVATVSNGTVAAFAKGTATITVTTADGGKTATCEVTVISTNEGVVIDGITWATRNVGEKGTFVDNPEDYGGYFNFEYAQIACPEGWRTPTHDEYVSLNAAGSEWTTENGVNGRLFGTSGENTIFLPAASCRDTSGTVYGQGSFGNYWSSTAYSGTNGYGLYFTSANVNPSNGSLYAYGFSVRCVRQE